MDTDVSTTKHVFYIQTRLPLWFNLKLKRLSADRRIYGFERKSLRIEESFAFTVPTINSPSKISRHNQTGKLLFRIQPPVCHIQVDQSEITKLNQSNTKFGTISSSVNLFLKAVSFFLVV